MLELVYYSIYSISAADILSNYFLKTILQKRNFTGKILRLSRYAISSLYFYHAHCLENVEFLVGEFIWGTVFETASYFVYSLLELQFYQYLLIIKGLYII